MNSYGAVLYNAKIEFLKNKLQLWECIFDTKR